MEWDAFKSRILVNLRYLMSFESKCLYSLGNNYQGLGSITAKMNMTCANDEEEPNATSFGLDPLSEPERSEPHLWLVLKSPIL